MLQRLHWISLAFIFIGSVMIGFVPYTVSGSELTWRSTGVIGGINHQRNDKNI